MPDAPHPEYSIVVPCYNEADNLQQVIGKILADLDGTEFAASYELILVNDGSTDESGRIIDALADTYAQIRAVQCERNGGMWRALQAGFHPVRGTFATFLPADGEIEASEAIRLMRLAPEADLVVSERKALSAEAAAAVRPWYREVLSWGNRLCARLLLGCDLSGAEGIFLLRWEVFRAWALAPRNDNSLYIELLARGFRGNYRIARTVMYYTLRRGGRSKVVNLRYIAGLVVDMFRLRLRLMRR